MIFGAQSRRFWLTALIALAMLLRAPAFAPAALAAPGDGWTPICSGGAIVYIYIGDGAPPGDAPSGEPDGEPCAVFGFGHLALSSPNPVSLPDAGASAPWRFSNRAAATARAAPTFRSRAPPCAFA